MREIDARGLACPAPVLLTKSTLEEESATHIKVILDNPAARQNVQRFLTSRGFQVTFDQNGADYLIYGTCDAEAEMEQTRPSNEKPSGTGRIMVMCASDRIGFGDGELGRKLMVNFLRTLKEMGPDLWRLVFVNTGVKLTLDDSQVLEDLQAYEEQGITILVCGTCLDHFNLLERKQVGETTNMLDIVTAMQVADKVINI